jgi:Flp pilus assembly protein CpaB
MKNNRIVMGLSVAGLIGMSYLGSRIYIDNRLELIDVPVAISDLSPRTQITESDIEVVKMPKAYLPQGLILDREILVGQYTLMSTTIPKGSFVYDTMVETLDEAKDYPSLLLKEGQVVYALEVDLKNTLGNTLQPFQSVDLYVSLVNNRVTFVDQLISHVRILSLKDKNGKDIEKPTDLPKLMLIALDQQQVTVLTKAIRLGDLIITPSAKSDSDKESVLIEKTPLLKILYER